jgi:hypothetical protein
MKSAKVDSSASRASGQAHARDSLEPAPHSDQRCHRDPHAGEGDGTSLLNASYRCPAMSSVASYGTILGKFR